MITQLNALAGALVPTLSIHASRGHSDNHPFTWLNRDLSGEELACFVSLAPGVRYFAELPIAIETSTIEWGALAEAPHCISTISDYLPCGVELSDDVDIASCVISWSHDSFRSFDRSERAGQPLELYFEIRRKDQTGPLLAAGKFTLIESNKNG